MKFVSVLARLLKCLIQQICLPALDKIGCVQCAWSVDLGICTAADLKRVLLQ